MEVYNCKWQYSIKRVPVSPQFGVPFSEKLTIYFTRCRWDEVACNLHGRSTDLEHGMDVATLNHWCIADKLHLKWCYAKYNIQQQIIIAESREQRAESRENICCLAFGIQHSLVTRMQLRQLKNKVKVTQVFYSIPSVNVQWNPYSYSKSLK